MSARRLVREMFAENHDLPHRLAIFMAVGGVVLLSLAGCAKKGGAAIVLAKEYVPATEISASPNESASPHSTESPTPRTIPEQWIVKVEMVADLKKVNVPVERSRWEALKEGDRVHVSYRQGKYTGTVWSAEID